MNCVELPDVKFNSCNLAPRSPGLHLSDIMNDIERVLYPKDYAKKDRSNNLFAEVGFVFEEALTLGWKSLIGQRPGEVSCDGVVCSPDGLDKPMGLIEEYKCTWRSSRHKPWDIWRWIMQTKAYCYVCGVNLVRFHVLYVMGDYKFSGPQYRVYLIEYTDQELQANWTLLVDHAKALGWL